MNKNIFTINKENENMRTGELIINKIKIKTPVFMPVATKATIKALSSNDIKKINFKIILCNLYHLINSPGIEIIKLNKKIKKFMNWKKLILTDSGGYQTHSLKKKYSGYVEIKEEGVLFKNYINGKKFLLTPEKCIEMQNDIESDIIMPLDFCIEQKATKKEVWSSINLMTNWLKKSLKFCEDNKVKKNKIFGIIHGSIYKDLRIEHLNQISQLDLFVYAIGGLNLGEKKEETWEICEVIKNKLNKKKPVYMMGNGEPEDILNAISLGIDMFDCIIPAKHARNGILYTIKEKIKIKKKKYEKDIENIEKDCGCEACDKYSRSYIRHLYKNKELLYNRLATIHNLYFYKNFMKKIRENINNNKFEYFKKEFENNYKYNKE